MPDAELDQLLRRPAVTAAVRDLNLPAIGLEDVLGALRCFGSVRIDVTGDARQPYVCTLESADGAECGRGRTVMTAAVACWAEALEAVGDYSRLGVAELERYLSDLA